MNLKEKINKKQKEIDDLSSQINKLSIKLKSCKKRKESLLEEFKELKTKFICNEYNVVLNETVFNIEDEEYLLRDISFIGNPIVSTKNKNGKWSVKSFDLGLFNWETKTKKDFGRIEL